MLYTVWTVCPSDDIHFILRLQVKGFVHTASINRRSFPYIFYNFN